MQARKYSNTCVVSVVYYMLLLEFCCSVYTVSPLHDTRVRCSFHGYTGFVDTFQVKGISKGEVQRIELTIRLNSVTYFLKGVFVDSFGRWE